MLLLTAHGPVADVSEFPSEVQACLRREFPQLRIEVLIPGSDHVAGQPLDDFIGDVVGVTPCSG